MVSTEQSTSTNPTEAETRPSRLVLNRPDQEAIYQPKTPNEWFTARWPVQAKTYGSPFLEHHSQDINQFKRVNPICLNHDFFASILGGDKRLGHNVIYYEPEMQWYYYDPRSQLYQTTSPEKLQALIRHWLIKCAEGLGSDINILNLFQEFRSDAVTKPIIQRAKSILAADVSFFSSTSQNKRKKGPEIPERIARVLVESMLEKRDGSILTLTEAYAVFSSISLEHQIQPIKRASFKEMMKDLMKEAFGISLRNDIPDQNNKQQQGWKGIRLQDNPTR